MIMTKQRIASAAVLVIGLLCSDLSAQGRSQSRGRSGGRSDSSVSVVIVFRAGDRATFHDYFVSHKITGQALPPGVAKNVARGKLLPPGIAKRVLPADLLAIGPKVDNDVSFAIVGEVDPDMRQGLADAPATDFPGPADGNDGRTLR